MAEDENVPMEDTLNQLRDLFRNKPATTPNKLTIVTKSDAERFRMTLERPISFQYLEEYFMRRQGGIQLNIFNANSSYDFLIQISNQTELDEAIRLHDLRNPGSKFRLFLSPKNSSSGLDAMRPDTRGVFYGTNIDEAYSETGTSAFTTAVTPARQRLQAILAKAEDAPRPPVDWKEGTCIGQGAHGRVLICEDNESGEHLVVKKIYARGDVNSMKRRMLCLSEEVNILSRLTHENIVRYRGVNITEDCVNIFMEYMTGGSLYDEINKKGFGALSAKRTIDTTRQILRGLEYLHDLEIVHRDIKSANILRHASPVVVKIGDFGSAQFMRALASLHSVDYCGTPHYTAPETLRDNRPYDEKADIWSVGITMVEMLTQRTPYAEIPPNAVLFKIAEDRPIAYTLPPTCPAELGVVIAKMLDRDPSRRPSAKQLLRMPIFASS